MGEAKLLLPKFALFELTVGTLALVDTVTGTTEWRLRVATFWLVTVRGICYCNNILTLNLGKW